MEPIIVTSVFYLAVAVLCLARPNAGRIFAGLFFLAMALGVNGYFVVANPQGYSSFANEAMIGPYRDVATFIVELSPRGFGVLLLAFEIVVGVLILGHGRQVKLGLAAAFVFLLAISPLLVMTLPNVILAATLAYLLAKEFDTSLWGALRASAHRRQWRRAHV
jgi:hypothetical protein